MQDSREWHVNRIMVAQRIARAIIALRRGWYVPYRL